jgi:TonB family protein
MVFAPDTSHTKSRHISLLLLMPTLLVSTAFANKKEAEAADMIGRAKQLSDIRAEGAPAFRLKLSFKIIKADGSVRNGTYTEIWNSKTEWRRETALGDFQRTEVASGKKLWRLDSTTAVPEHISDILAFSHAPGELQGEFWKPGQIEDNEIRGLRVRCIETDPDQQGTRSALCFDNNNGMLAAQLQPLRIGTRIAAKDCIFSDYQNFGNHLVARSYQCFEDGHPSLQGRIVEIVADSAPDPALFAPLDGAKESVNCLSQVKPGLLIDRVTPRRPMALSMRNALVVISAVIGTDGKTHDLRVTSPPDPDFDQPALEAVRQWRYKPFTCDGVPIEVEAEAEVGFHRN